MKTEFENGSVLYTGNDVTEILLKSFNRRNNYDHKDCSFCMHENNDEEFCDDCSVYIFEGGCSCHINPPCSFCENNKFEVSNFLINYKHHKKNKWNWECYKSSEKVFNKLTVLEKDGFVLSAETLTTGEIAIYLEKGGNDHDIVICKKPNFKNAVNSLVIYFK